MTLDGIREFSEALNLLPTVHQAVASDFLQGNGVIDSTKVAEAVAEAQNISTANSNSLNVFFVLVSGYLVFLMQAGFAMLTAGSVRTKNTKNVLLKNVLDACVGAVAYFLFGWAFAYGSNHPFIGSNFFALSRRFGEPGVDSNGNSLSSFFFQWAFAATAATIVSGSVAERTSFYAYMAYAFVLTAFVYPVVSHWVWGGGFLSNLLGDGRGMIDFAGCAVVHMVGGFAGLIGAIIVGPRLGRFDSDGRPIPIPGHSATLATLGTFVLWFGWYGFNPGSALGISGDSRFVAERCAVTTTLAGATAGVVTMIVVKLRDHIFDLISVLNGILAGLVSITACCAFVEPYAAVIIGAIGALVYIGAASLLIKMRIDDPLEAFPIHGACGLWGVIAAGLFNVERHQNLAIDPPPLIWGAFYGGGGQLLGINLAGAIIIAIWTVVLIGALFFILKVAGILRISEDEELIGNDVSKHGGTAYPADAIASAERMAQKEIDAMEDAASPGKVEV